jgi:prophage antirepressor-like protein
MNFHLKGYPTNLNFLTKKGYYKLAIFSKFGEPQKFTEALTLLIFNSNESETTSAVTYIGKCRKIYYKTL